MELDPKCQWAPYPITQLTVWHPPNGEGRDFVMGDLHGDWPALQQALAEISFNPTCDRLFSLGDLTDRGPDSLRCLRWAVTASSQRQRPWFFPIRGNHEDLMLDAVLTHHHHPSHFWYLPVNGGEWGLDHRQELESLAKEVATWPLIRCIQGKDGVVVLVHADLPVAELAEIDAISSNPRALTHCLWSRRRVASTSALHSQSITQIYVGHTVVSKVTALGKVTAIDTGCGKGGLLSVVEIGGESPHSHVTEQAK